MDVLGGLYQGVATVGDHLNPYMAPVHGYNMWNWVVGLEDVPTGADYTRELTRMAGADPDTPAYRGTEFGVHVAAFFTPGGGIRGTIRGLRQLPGFLKNLFIRPRPINPAPVANAGRVFTSGDPHVAGAANAIEAALPGRVVGVNSQRPMSNGLSREVDIDLGNLLVQVKSGSARGITGQIARTQASTGTPTIGYAPGISDAAWRNAASEGIPILRSPSELLSYIREFG